MQWYPKARLLFDTELRVGPDTTYAVLKSLKKGDEVVVYSSYNGWCKIKQVAVKKESTSDEGKIQWAAMRGWICSNALHRSLR